MSDVIETIGNFRHVTCAIVYSEAFESPREWDNLGTFWTWERQYNSPDDLPNRGWDPEDCFASEFSLKDITETRFWNTGDHQGYRDYILSQVEKLAIILPVYKYEHGGIEYNTAPFSCPWDSGQVGFIFVSLEDLRKEYGVKRVTKAIREKAEKRLKAEVEVYSYWANGQVYGYDISYNETGETLESCGGFIGYSNDEHLKSEALASAEYWERTITDERQQEHEALIAAQARELEASRPDMYSHA